MKLSTVINALRIANADDAWNNIYDKANAFSVVDRTAKLKVLREGAVSKIPKAMGLDLHQPLELAIDIDSDCLRIPINVILLQNLTNQNHAISRGFVCKVIRTSIPALIHIGTNDVVNHVWHGLTSGIFNFHNGEEEFKSEFSKLFKNDAEILELELNVYTARENGAIIILEYAVSFFGYEVNVRCQHVMEYGDNMGLNAEYEQDMYAVLSHVSTKTVIDSDMYRLVASVYSS